MKHLTYMLLAMMVLLGSCNISNEKFDKNIWGTADGFHLGKRKSMLKDLMKNHLKEGLPYKKIIELLGEPDEGWGNYSKDVVYEIYEDFGLDIDPIGCTLLTLEFDKDSILVRKEVMEIDVKDKNQQ